MPGAQAVKRYKQSTGLEVDPAVQAQAQVFACIFPGVLLTNCCTTLLLPLHSDFPAVVSCYVCIHSDMLRVFMRVVAGVAQGQLDTGMAVFRRGQLTASLAYFEEASALMPLRSPVRLHVALL
jgi:hypothetical protein